MLLCGAAAAKAGHQGFAHIFGANQAETPQAWAETRQ
jgi:hypothetical protein